MASAALLIGVPRPDPTTVGETRIEWPALHGVARDLEAVSAMLLQADNPLDERSIVTLILPGDTDAHNIRRQLGHYTGQLQPGDTFLLMLDGHGYHVADVDGDEGDGWDEVFIASDGIPLLDDEFAAMWAAVPAGVHIIGLVDSCCADTSGLFIEHPARLLGQPRLSVTLRTQPGPERLFLAASLQEQDAYETTVTGEERGVLSAALTDVWHLTDGARTSYRTLFGYAQALARRYDPRQTVRARFAGTSLQSTLDRAPFAAS